MNQPVAAGPPARGAGDGEIVNGVVEKAASATAVCADAHRPRMGRRVAALHGADFHP